MPFEGPGQLPPREARSLIPDSFDEYLATAIQWLEQHWGDRHCMACDGELWRVQAVFALATAGAPWPDPPGGGAGMHVIPVTCTTCGRTEFVNAFYVFRLPP